MTAQAPTLDEIKRLNWSNSAVSFYVVKRRIVQRIAQYEICLVNIQQCIQHKLKSVIADRLASAQGTMEYAFHSVDQDEHLLTIPTDSTGFLDVINIITGDSPPALAQNQEQILDIWFYVARFDIPKHPTLWAVRKAPKGWATKKSRSIQNLVFTSNMQLEVDNNAVFKIDDYFDFFSCGGQVFIFYKGAFERDLNFREGIIQHKNDLVQELSQLNIFANAQDLSSLIGNNMRLLRKIAQVQQSGYYRDTNFLNNLRQANTDRNLGLNYDSQGLMVVDADSLEKVFHYLTNGRLESIINQEVFDVDAKTKVA